MADKNTIKNWFKTDLIPTQAQFWATWDSFWHKEEKIPITAIDDIENILNEKADTEALSNHVGDVNAHADLFAGKVDTETFENHNTDETAHADLFSRKLDVEAFETHQNDVNAHSLVFSGKEDKSKKGVAGGYAPLNEFQRIASQYLAIVDDLVTGGSDSLLSGEQGKVLKSQIDAINLLLTSDDVNLDTVQELVDAIKTVETSLETILVNDLTTGGVTKALTAEQGKILQSQVTKLISDLSSKEDKTNKVSTLDFSNNTTYPTTQLLKDQLDLKINLSKTAGITWDSRAGATDNNWTSVTYGNGLFVAVSSTGTGNRVMTSEDGVTWTSRTSVAVDMSWTSVTYGNYGNGLFVAVCSSGIMTSEDGINWTSRGAPSSNLWQSVTYGNGLFVAVSSTGTGDRVMTSQNGITWTPRAAVVNNWRSVTYGNGLFVAVSATGVSDRVMTSEDGITWTPRAAATNNLWQSVTYGNGLFVAVSSTGTGNRVMTSQDGITWTSRVAAVDNDWRLVTYGNGLFVAVSATGTGDRVMTSEDGITWTSRTSVADNDWRSVTYGNGLFVAVSSTGKGDRVMTSRISFSGNSATASSLQTTRTIFGQKFDGTNDVTGPFSGATTGIFSETVVASPATVDNELATLGQVKAVATSGSFTPTISNLVNCSSVTVKSATYTKIDNIICINITANGTVTDSNSRTSFYTTLPFTRAGVSNYVCGISSINEVNMNAISRTGTTKIVGQFLELSGWSLLSTGNHNFTIQGQYDINQ